MYNSWITVYTKVHARVPIPALDTMYLINRLMDLEHQITLPNRCYQKHNDINLA